MSCGENNGFCSTVDVDSLSGGGGGGGGDVLLTGIIPVDPTNPGATDTRAGLSPYAEDTPFATIAAALAAASSGDVVLLARGTYTPAATLTIPAGVTLRGVSRTGVTVSRGHTANIIQLGGLNCGIENLSIVTPTAGSSDIAVLAGTSESVLVRGVDLVGTGVGYGFRSNAGIIETTDCRILGPTNSAWWCSTHPDSVVRIRDCRVESGNHSSGVVQVSRGRCEIDGLLLTAGCSSAYGVRVQGTDTQLFGRNIDIEGVVTDGLWMGTASGAIVFIDGFRCRSATTGDINILSTSVGRIKIIGADVREANVFIANALASSSVEIDYLRTQIEVHASAGTTTTSATPVALAGMTTASNTPAKGLWRVKASVEATHDSDEESVSLYLYVDGVQYDVGGEDIIRTANVGGGSLGYAPGQQVLTLPEVMISLEGDEDVALYWSTSAATATINRRSLLITPA